MDAGNVIALVLGVVTIVVVPMLAITLRGVVRWTRLESDLKGLAQDMRNLVQDNDKIHSAMLQTMREDRAATDRRLRFLEENVWPFLRKELH